MARRISDAPVLETLAVCAIAGGQPAVGGPSAPAGASPLRHEMDALDFWVGCWDMFTGEGQRLGTTVIEKVLGGCAVLETWRGIAGDEGKSLFVYKPARHEWKQISVNEPGGWQEKTLVKASADSLQFEGESLVGGARWLFRTTLTRMPDARVRHFTDRSRDGGATWQVSFDVMCVKRTGS